MGVTAAKFRLAFETSFASSGYSQEKKQYQKTKIRSFEFETVIECGVAGVSRIIS